MRVARFLTVRSRIVLFLLCSALVSLPSAVVAEDRPGSFGMALEVDGEGFFLDPTLKSVTITAVTPSLPAAKAGIAPKDQIIEAEGRQIAGTKARELQPLLKRPVGESVRLRLKRPSGEEYAVTLTSVARPAAP